MSFKSVFVTNEEKIEKILKLNPTANKAELERLTRLELIMLLNYLLDNAIKFELDKLKRHKGLLLQ